MKAKRTRAFVTLRRNLVGVAIGVCIPALTAQRPQTAEPGAAGPMRPSAISGVVIDGDSRAAIPNAVVYLSGGLNATVLTDASGRFVFTGLPPGRYNLGAEKLGYFGGLLGDPSPRLEWNGMATGARETTKRLVLREEHTAA